MNLEITRNIRVGAKKIVDGSESDDILIKSYVSSSLPSNDDLVYSSKLKVNKISGTEWDSLVIKSEVPVMVMFTQYWCPLCETLSPVLDKFDTEYTGRFKFYTLDTAEETDIASRYHVRTSPTIILSSKTETRWMWCSNIILGI
ncbi:hypothetical protein Bca52824_017124 [Brassica carinata]|uniref:Thioredoxin domain-containing protein n=1 Tax=Brassica carinata TaxID=52824 RepID=A0A8X8AWZ2_BRACI|nr:hypothetical protein Bca52824_017124 [Brassica carinata]